MGSRKMGRGESGWTYKTPISKCTFFCFMPLRTGRNRCRKCSKRRRPFSCRDNKCSQKARRWTTKRGHRVDMGGITRFCNRSHGCWASAVRPVPLRNGTHAACRSATGARWPACIRRASIICWEERTLRPAPAQARRAGRFRGKMDSGFVYTRGCLGRNGRKEENAFLRRGAIGVDRPQGRTRLRRRFRPGRKRLPMCAVSI